MVSGGFRLDLLLETARLARSTYYYQLKQLDGHDKDKETKGEIQEIYYEYKGNYVENGLKFIHLVYFDEQSTYIYGYEANSKDFKKNYKRMIVYLESFTKTSGL